MRSGQHKETSLSGRFEVARNPTSSDSVAIVFEDVIKRFRITRTEKEQFLSLLSRKYRRSMDTALALNRINLSVNRGEAINIVGKDGAGKTTLLNLVSGVLLPTYGKIAVNGNVKVSAVSTLGFDPSLSGLANLYLKALHLGLNQQKAKEIVPKAVEFSELGDLINEPYRTLRKAHRARLVPAFVLSMELDILLIDGGIHGGDKNFTQKCLKRLDELMADDKTTVLFTSFAPAMERTALQRAIILNKGKLVFDGGMGKASESFKTLI